MKLTFLENLEVIKKLFVKNNELLGILFLFLLILFIFISDSRVKVFKNIISGVLIYVILIGSLFIFYPNIIIKLLSNLMSGIINLVIEPNINIYVFIIIVSQFILLENMYYKKDKVLKVINYIIYVILNLLFITFIWNIKNLKLSIDGIYQSKESISIMKVSIALFIVWMILIYLRKLAILIVNKRYNHNIYLSSEKAYENTLKNIKR